LNVERPVTFRFVLIATEALISTLLANVDNPDTLSSSSSVCPSTSKLPFASMASVNVENPVTSKSLVVVSPVDPSVSNVDIPETFKLSNSVCPTTSNWPVALVVLIPTLPMTSTEVLSSL